MYADTISRQEQIPNHEGQEGLPSFLGEKPSDDLAQSTTYEHLAAIASPVRALRA